MAWVQVQGAQQAADVQGACEEAERGGQGEADGADGGAAAAEADGGKDGGVKIAYADPPYIGQARKHYSHDEKCAEVDHATLIAKLEAEYDGWALSCSTPSLQQILALCPLTVRIGAWVKPFCAFKANVNPAYAWEPVVFKLGPRRRTRQQPTQRDWIAESITLKRGLTGVKPDKFCYWLFEMLNLEPGDEFHDLYPGSGAVTRAWEAWRQGNTQTRMAA